MKLIERLGLVNPCPKCSLGVNDWSISQEQTSWIGPDFDRNSKCRNGMKGSISVDGTVVTPGTMAGGSTTTYIAWLPAPFRRRHNNTVQQPGIWVELDRVIGT